MYVIKNIIFFVDLPIFTIMKDKNAIIFWMINILIFILILSGCYAANLSTGWLAGIVAVMAGNGIAFIRLEKKQNGLLDKYQSVRQRKNEMSLRCNEVENKWQALQQEQDALIQLHHIKTLLFQTISGDVQHPLVKLKIKLGALVEEKIDEEPFKKEVTSLAQMVGDISQLLENLLQWSKYQAQRQTPVPRINEWAALVESAIHEVKFGADKKQIVLKNPLEVGIKVFADGDMMKPLLKTLLQNAIGVMEKGNAIVFSASLCDDNTEIQLILQGEFPLKKLFVESFSGESYNSFQPEMGRSVSLGWMFCKAVAADNNGNIRISEKIDNSVVISMQFPSK
jgi:K+-sensing histidine kinase KdpD